MTILLPNHVKLVDYDPSASCDTLGPVMECFAKHGVTCRNAHQWRIAIRNNIIQPYGGTIKGLPALRGRALCTDGIQVLVETATGYYIGHWGWFVPDEIVKKKKETRASKLKDKYK